MIVIVDFGSQTTHLIGRRIRDLGVKSEIVLPQNAFRSIKKLAPRGIILSGGPASVFGKDALLVDKAIFELGIPVLGICYGLEVLGQMLGGKVAPGKKKEYGPTDFSLKKDCTLFSNWKKNKKDFKVWMSHFDQVVEPPKGSVVVGSTPAVKVAAFADEVKKILTNQFYLGRFYYMGQLWPGKHQPLVSPELFDRVQTVMNCRLRHRHTKTWRPFAFTGLMKCGHCGMSVTAEIKMKQYLYGASQKFIYYHCSRRSKTTPCRQPFVRQHEVDQQLSEAIRSATLTPAEADWFMNRISRDKLGEQKELDGVVNSLNGQAAAIKLKLDRLVDLYLSGEIDRDDYKKRKRELVFAKREQEDRILKLQNHPTGWFGPMEEWVKLALSAKKTAEYGKPLRRKRDWLLKTGSDLTLEDKKVAINWPDPWAALTRRRDRSEVGAVSRDRTEGLRFTIPPLCQLS